MERRAILEALEQEQRAAPAPPSPWRRAGLGPGLKTRTIRRARRRARGAAQRGRSRARRSTSARPRPAAPTRRCRPARRPAAAKPPTARGDCLRPGLELAEVAGMEHDAALERRQPQRGDEELPHDDQRDHPARRDSAASTSITSTARTRILSAAGIEQRAERRGVAAAARDPAVEPVRRHRGGEERGRPVVVIRGSSTRRAR